LSYITKLSQEKKEVFIMLDVDNTFINFVPIEYKSFKGVYYTDFELSIAHKNYLIDQEANFEAPIYYSVSKNNKIRSYYSIRNGTYEFFNEISKLKNVQVYLTSAHFNERTIALYDQFRIKNKSFVDFRIKHAMAEKFMNLPEEEFVDDNLLFKSIKLFRKSFNIAKDSSVIVIDDKIDQVINHDNKNNHLLKIEGYDLMETIKTIQTDNKCNFNLKRLSI
jgi:hypothetical protein